MKIGVMTYWFGDSNYGQILQCWALQHFLRHEGHESYVIRYLALGEPWWKCLIRRVLNRRAPVTAKDRLRNFEGFRTRNLNFSPLYTSYEQIKSRPPKYDAYIAGSDQIWVQPLKNSQIKPYFLDFGDPHVKRIAYAPSFGMVEYPENDKPELKELLTKMDAVSCREYSGVDICRNVGVEATKVLDPTLLLKEQDYTEGLKLQVSERKGLFIYSLNINKPEDIHWSILKKLADDKGWKTIVTPAAGYNEGSELFGDEVQYIYSTPQQWVEQIANSELVVTTSFHGIVFSIIMHTPFVYVPLSGAHSKSNNRIIDLLKDLGLGNRIQTEKNTISEIMDKQIDWEDVETRLGKQRDSSIQFLANALSKKKQ